MEALNAWITQIALLILFATFLELLLPNNSYKKFIKVIMGLLVLVAVLQPVIDLVQYPWGSAKATEVAARNIGDDKAGIANQAVGLQSEKERIALEQYRKELSKQIRALAGSVEGVVDTKVEIVLYDQKAEQKFGMIKSIVIFAKPGAVSQAQPDINGVTKVKIGEKPPAKPVPPVLSEQTRQRLQKIMAEFYHLRVDQVIVREWQA